MLLKVRCPGCRRTVRVDARDGGHAVECPSCGGDVEVPGLHGQGPEPPEPPATWWLYLWLVIFSAVLAALVVGFLLLREMVTGWRSLF
jgi:hypothetical protein